MVELSWPRFLWSVRRLQSGACRLRVRRFRVQRLLDRIFDLALALQADNLVHNLSIPADEETLRQRWDASVSVTDRFLADQHGIVDSHFLCELGDVFLAGVVHRDADNLQALGLVLLLQFDEPRHFDFARTAP